MKLPDAVMMLAGSVGTGRTNSQTSGLKMVTMFCTTMSWHLLKFSQQCCGTCLAYHKLAVALAQSAAQCKQLAAIVLSNRELKGAKCFKCNACPTPCTCSCAWDVALIWELGNLG